MRRARWIRVAVVASTIAGCVAYSIHDPDVVATPAVAVVMVTPTSGATAQISVQHPGSPATPIEQPLDGATRVDDCDSEVASVARGATIAVSCGPLPRFTMKRCSFRAMRRGSPVVAYTGLCVARGTSELLASDPELALVVAPGMRTATHTASFLTPVALARVSVQIDDQDDIFEVVTPCATKSGCNDFPRATAANDSFELAFACTPDDEVHVARAYILTDTGAQATVRLTCAAAVSPLHPPAGGPPDAGVDAPSFDAPMFDAPVDSSGSGSDASITFDAPVDAPSFDAPPDAPGAPDAPGPPDAPGFDASFDLDAAVDGGGEGGIDAPVDSAVDAPAMGFDAPIDGPGADAPGADAPILDGGGMANLMLVSGNPIDFGAVLVGQHVQRMFTLGNGGSVALPQVDYQIVPPGVLALDFGPSSIGPGATVTGTVSCNPTVKGVYTATLHISAPAAATGSPIDLVLTCHTPPHLAVTPTSVMLATAVGSNAPATVTLTNDGAVDLDLSSIAITPPPGVWSGTIGAPCSGGSCMLAPDASVGVDLLFAPTAIGVVSAQLVIASTDPLQPTVTVPLDGTGEQALLDLHPGTPMPLDFGDVPIGSTKQLTFQLDNNGNITLNGVIVGLSGDPAFGIVSSPSSVPMAGSSVTLSCTPTAETDYTGTVSIMAPAPGSPISIALSCHGIPVSAGPQLTASLGSVTATSRIGVPKTTTIDLRDAGMTALTISSISVTGANWMVSSPCVANCPLAANNATLLTVTVSYTPTVIAATDMAVLTIVSDDPLSPKTIMLTGTGQGATFGGAPATLAFGTHPSGMPASASFDLANSGNIPLIGVAYAITGANAGAFFVEQGPTIVGVGSPATVRISCTPPGAGAFVANLHIDAAMADVPPRAADVALTCTGQAGNLAASPTSLDFGEIRAGDTVARTKSFRLSSTGVPLVLTQQPTILSAVPGLTVDSAGSAPIDATGVAVGVHYQPAQTDTTFSTSIASIAGNTATVTVSGKVVTPDLDEPAALDVGSWCAGQATTPVALALHSTGDGSITVAQPTLASGAGSPFVVTDGMPAASGYPYVLPAMQDVTVQVTMKPSAAAGKVTDAIAWQTDAPGHVSFTTPLTGEILTDNLAVTPASLDYPGTVAKRDSLTLFIRLQDCGTAPVTYSGAAATPSVFVVENPPPASLAPGAVAMIGVSFHPDHIGVVEGELTVQTSRGQITVPLNGAGIGGSGSTGTPDTFYGCGCRSSGPGAAFPLALVMLGLKRRRSRR